MLEDALWNCLCVALSWLLRSSKMFFGSSLRTLRDGPREAHLYFLRGASGSGELRLCVFLLCLAVLRCVRRWH